jgi:hypothetical protein
MTEDKNNELVQRGFDIPGIGKLTPYRDPVDVTEAERKKSQRENRKNLSKREKDEAKANKSTS